MCVSDVLELRLQAMEEFTINVKQRAIFVSVIDFGISQSGVLFGFAAAFVFYVMLCPATPQTTNTSKRQRKYPNPNKCQNPNPEINT